MAAHVHPTAVVDPDAILHEDVQIGPYCVIGAGADLGARTRLLAHVTIMGNVRFGTDNVVYPYCVIGSEPQDLGYHGEETRVEIGDHNTFREHVTVHRATTKEDGVTRVGSNNFIMTGSHLAHDVIVGSNIYMANLTTLAGHVHIHDYATLSGIIGIHHFTTIGSYSFIGGMARITTDVPPYMLIEGHPSVVRCVNLVGLRRRGFSQADIRSLTEAHRLLYRIKMSRDQAKDILQSNGHLTDPVQKLFAFLDQQRQGKNGRGREKVRAA